MHDQDLDLNTELEFFPTCGWESPQDSDMFLLLKCFLTSSVTLVKSFSTPQSLLERCVGFLNWKNSKNMCLMRVWGPTCCYKSHCKRSRANRTLCSFSEEPVFHLKDSYFFFKLYGVFMMHMSVRFLHSPPETGSTSMFSSATCSLGVWRSKTLRYTYTHTHTHTHTHTKCKFLQKYLCKMFFSLWIVVLWCFAVVCPCVLTWLLACGWLR